MVKGKPTGGVRVDSSDIDILFHATATEPLRKPQSRSSDQSAGRKAKLEKKAEAIVERAKGKKK